MCGVVDIGYGGETAAQVESELEQLYNRSVNKTDHMIMMTITPYNPNSTVCQRIKDVNEWLRNFTTNNSIPFVDTWTPLVGADNCSFNPAYTDDALHPNVAGAKVLAKAIWSAVFSNQSWNATAVEQITENVSWTGLNTTNNAPLYIGALANGSYPLNASVGEIRIYPLALSEAQIRLLFNDSPVMASQELRVGDTWQCTVTPLSAWLVGPTNSSNNLTILALSQLNLAWNQTTLSLGSVAQAASNASNATVTATGNHTSVTVTNVSGNGTGFITATPTSLGNLNDTNTSQVQFNCSPGGSQALGYYEAVFNVNSSNFGAGNNITVGCTVAALTSFTIQRYYLPLAVGVVSAYAPFTGGQTNVNSVPFATVSLNETTISDYWSKYLPDIYFNSSGVIVQRVNGTTSTMNVLVTVVQFDSSLVKVQNGTFSLTTGSTTSSIGDDVNLSGTALVFYYKSTDLPGELGQRQYQRREPAELQRKPNRYEDSGGEVRALVRL
jgi:hypothetical protein